jgi:L,D-transpeptidase YcbB
MEQNWRYNGVFQLGVSGIMRKNLLVASCSILLLIGADLAFAEDPASPFLKLCEAEGNAADASTADAPIEPGTDPGAQKAQAKPARSAEDVALSERLQDLIANRLQQYVTRSQDRTAVEAFYRGRDFAPLWVNAAGALPGTRKAVDFLRSVAADGLDPKDYPTPTFADLDPTQLAADELTLTNSVITFVRHASTGRVAFSRVSSSIYFDLKSPDLQQVLEKIASSHDIAATLDSFNPQQPQYKALKAALAHARKTGDTNVVIPADEGGQSKVAGARIGTIVANMERWVGCHEIWAPLM